MMLIISTSFFFFFTDPATTEIYTLSLHDALPISPEKSAPIKRRRVSEIVSPFRMCPCTLSKYRSQLFPRSRSEEHTSELQSRGHLVCRLLLEKKKKKKKHNST